MPRPCRSDFGRRSLGVDGFRRRRQSFRYRGMKVRELPSVGDGRGQMQRRGVRSSCDLLITRLLGCRDSAGLCQCSGRAATSMGAIMAKPKKRSKAQKRPGRAKSARRDKARKGAKAARAETTKRTVARAKPKRAPAKKAAPKQPVAPTIETAVVEVVEQPTASGGAV
jgi:hypothetical protein